VGAGCFFMALVCWGRAGNTTPPLVARRWGSVSFHARPECGRGIDGSWAGEGSRVVVAMLPRVWHWCWHLFRFVVSASGCAAGRSFWLFTPRRASCPLRRHAGCGTTFQDGTCTADAAVLDHLDVTVRGQASGTAACRSSTSTCELRRVLRTGTEPCGFGFNDLFGADHMNK